MPGLKTMTVKQLREELELFNDDDKVIFTTGYGDIGNTQQALGITEVQSEQLSLVQTAYSTSGWELPDEDELDEDELDEDELDEDEMTDEIETVETYIVLRS